MAQIKLPKDEVTILKVKDLLQQNLKRQDIADMLGITRNLLYKYIQAIPELKNLNLNTKIPAEEMIYLDSNGKTILLGEKSVSLEIIGVGRGECDVLLADNTWQLYNEHQGYVPLEMMLEREDVIITNLK